MKKLCQDVSHTRQNKMNHGKLKGKFILKFPEIYRFYTVLKMPYEW